jgi:hypothetical protein
MAYLYFVCCISNVFSEPPLVAVIQVQGEGGCQAAAPPPTQWRTGSKNIGCQETKGATHNYKAII